MTGPGQEPDHRGADARLRTVVLTCADLGIGTADALAGEAAVEVVAVVSAPHRRLPLPRRVRKVLRERGPAGLLALAAARLARGTARRDEPGHTPVHHVPIRRFADLHGEDCLAFLRAARLDVGVVDGTYILRETLFSIPRLGCINVHCGRVPEYRGSPPAFWELYQGTPEVGITIHTVSSRLDAGSVLATSAYPLDLAPPGDPARYVRDYWARTLRPGATALLRRVLADMAAGRAVAVPQPHTDQPPNRTPTWQQVRELRRRVRKRRRRDASA